MTLCLMRAPRMNTPCQKSHLRFPQRHKASCRGGDQRAHSMCCLRVKTNILKRIFNHLRHFWTPWHVRTHVWIWARQNKGFLKAFKSWVAYAVVCLQLCQVQSRGCLWDRWHGGVGCLPQSLLHVESFQSKAVGGGSRHKMLGTAEKKYCCHLCHLYLCTDYICSKFSWFLSMCLGIIQLLSHILGIQMCALLP